MFERHYEPHPVLKGFVNNIMIHHIRFNIAEPGNAFSLPPLPEHGLIFYLFDPPSVENPFVQKKDKLASCVVIGPQVSRHTIIPGQNHLMIKVGFQPGGLFRLLGIPMSEFLCNDHFNANELLGNEIMEVIDALREVDSYDDMKILVEEFLLRKSNQLKTLIPIDLVLPKVIGQRGLINIDKLASDACLSRRQFERLFQQRIGLSPKYFSRLVRFNHAWILKQQKPATTWTEIAYECGYFDQMHLIKDFHEFAGANPRSLELELLQSPAKFSIRFYH